MKINIGCGKDIKEGYVNIDMTPAAGVDMVCDAASLSLPDRSVEEIFASDVIEHFPWRDVKNVLAEWRRVLSDEGTLLIRTPDLEGLIRLYKKRPEGWRREDMTKSGIDPIVERIFGGQDFEGNYHYVIFDKHSLAELLEDAGFFVETITPDGEDISNMCVTAFKKLKGSEAVLSESSCNKINSCPVIKEFMEDIDKIEIVKERPIRICADDLRFYGQHSISDNSVLQNCTPLRRLKKELSEMHVTWEAPTFGASGYAFASRGYMTGIDDIGIRLTVKPLWGDCRLGFEEEEENA